MTLTQTRQLGIEFERRVQTILPTTELQDKLDTETIYSFLNQYQSQYVHDIYRNLDNIESGSQISAHVERVLQPMLKSVALDEIDNSEYAINYDNTGISDSARSKVYKTPSDYQMYVRSVSNVNRTFSWIGPSNADDVLPNVLTSQTDVWKLMETPHNKLRILRYPAAILSPYTVEDAPILVEKYQQVYDDTPATTAQSVSISKATLMTLSDISRNVYINGQKATSLTITATSYSSCGDGVNTPRSLDRIDEDIVISDMSNRSSRLAAINRMLEIEGSLETNPVLDDPTTENVDESGVTYAIKYTSNITNIKIYKSNADLIDSLNLDHKPTLTIIHDRYTNVTGVKLLYYKEPSYFDLMTSTSCELPMDCFNDIVAGAVDLYINYVRGGIRQQEEDGRRDRFNRRQREREQQDNGRQN